MNLGVNFKKMRPRTVVEQMAKAQSLGINVVLPAMERTRFVKLSRNAGSLDSLRSGARHWHIFATSVMNYKEGLSAPPRNSDHVLCWLSSVCQNGTGCNYLQYLRIVRDIGNLSTSWYDNTVQAWKKRAHKLKLANGFKSQRGESFSFRSGYKAWCEHSMS